MSIVKSKLLTLIGLLLLSVPLIACEYCADYDSDDFAIRSTKAHYDASIDSVIFEIAVSGRAGRTLARETGALDGAHVLGYVFPTTLVSTDVGFSATDGIVALALTSHPDFDNTPLWDEDLDGDYENDGVVWHAHWVVLGQDERVAGGLSVKSADLADSAVTLPPSAPRMPMYMDSPGFNVALSGKTIRVIVPANRIKRKTGFKFDAVTAFMRVNMSNEALPMLGVYKVYSVASGGLSLPYQVSR